MEHFTKLHERLDRERRADVLSNVAAVLICASTVVAIATLAAPAIWAAKDVQATYQEEVGQ